MKKSIPFIIVLLISLGSLFAQTPEKFNYQAIARDISGNLLANQSVTFRISILQGSEIGTAVYVETHAKTTNGFGQVTLNIGGGTQVSGTFSTISWGSSSYYIKTEMDATGGSAYETMGTSQLLSVPYSLYSKESGSGGGTYTGGTGINVTGNTITNTLPNITHTGDATGNNSLIVERIQGRNVSAYPPTNGQALKWNGSAWAPADDNNTAYTAGTGINVSGTTISNTLPDQVVTLTMGSGLSSSGSYPNFSLSNTLPNATHTGDATGSNSLTVERIRGRTVSAAIPSPGQVLKWNASEWAPANDNNTTLPGGSSSQTLRYDGSNWVGSSVLTNDGTGLGVGGSPLANHQFYLFRPATSFGANYTNIYAFRSGTNNAASGGTGWPVAQVDAAIKGYSYYGNNYSAGVAGYSSLDYTSSAAVIGGKHNGTTFGALAYKDENSDTWAGYFNGNINIIGTMRIVGGVPATGKVLTSDANGNASWQTLSGASAWATSGNDIYSNNSGNVGIGTSTPAKKLDVVGDAIINGHTIGRGTGNIETNLAIGKEALLINTTGIYNTSLGIYSMTSNLTGSYNTSIGSSSLYYNITGGNNIAIGLSALCFNKGNSRSTAIGIRAMLNADDRANGLETFNTALGYEALKGGTDPSANTGQYNTAIGDQALYSITSGDYNTANGAGALYSNTTGYFNIAIGTGALYDNTTGSYNTASGSNTLYSNKANSRSTTIGFAAMFYADDRTTGRETFNTALGYEALKGSETPANNTGRYNTAVGDQALYSNTSGENNVALGNSALYQNTTGSANTSCGSLALSYNQTGYANTAYGFHALWTNETGNYNTSCGSAALSTNQTGSLNTAYGTAALNSNTTGNNNTGIGYAALFRNVANSRSTAIGYSAMEYADNQTEGVETYNTAVGYQALMGSTTAANNIGQHNTAIGDQALYSNSSGGGNTATGNGALKANADGHGNVANGGGALYSNTSGDDNTAMGFNALSLHASGNDNTAIGKYALVNITNGSNNTAVGSEAAYLVEDVSFGTFVGYEAGVSHEGLTNASSFGYQAYVPASNTVRIGNSSVTSIGGYAGWTNVSDERFKNNVQEDVSGLDFILKLRPVTYNMAMNELAGFLREDQQHDKDGNIVTNTSEFDRKARADKEAIRYTGFLAQEVETAANSVGYDFSGVEKPQNEQSLYGLRYAEFVVPMVKAMQEQQQMIEKQNERIGKQDQLIQVLMKEIELLKK